MAGAEAQFSIYKINLEAVESSFSIKSEKDKESDVEKPVVKELKKKTPFDKQQHL